MRMCYVLCDRPVESSVSVVYSVGLRNRNQLHPYLVKFGRRAESHFGLRDVGSCRNKR
jgi:hypothetical protein